MTQGLTKLKRLLVLVLLYSSLIACTSMQHIDDARVIDTSDPGSQQIELFIILTMGLIKNSLNQSHLPM